MFYNQLHLCRALLALAIANRVSYICTYICSVEWGEISTKHSVANANKLTSGIFVYIHMYIVTTEILLESHK